MPLYLDYSATTPVHPRVLDKMIHVYKNEFGNAGSRTHVFGQRASQIVTEARRSLAVLLDVDPSDVVFTSGATESNNIAILGLARWGLAQGKRHILSTPIEHKAVLEPLAYLEKQGFEVEYVPIDSSGRVDATEVCRRVRSDTLFVSVMHANNETGVIQPVHEIAEFLQKTPTYFHVDAAQTCGKLVKEVQSLRYDLLTITAHKMYGPQGIGALVVRRRGFRRPPLRPIMFGGGQEGGLRPGTIPVALVAGFGVAATIALHEHESWMNHYSRVRTSILEQLAPFEYTINGDPTHMMPNCLNISFTGVDSEALMLAVRDKIAISNGSACTSADYRPSHVLEAMGLDEDRVSGAVRLSWGPWESVDLSPLTQALSSILAE